MDNYFKRINEEADGMIGGFEVSEMKGLLDMMVEEGRVEVGEEFREKLYEFLRSNLILNSE